MVLPVRLIGAVGISCLVALAAAAAQGDDSIVCASAGRDWNAMESSVSLNAARSFLSTRVKPECAVLSSSVRHKIAELEAQAAPVSIEESPPGRFSTVPRRSLVRRQIAPKSTPAAPAIQAREGSLTTTRWRLFDRDPATGVDLVSSEPNWFQVLDRYPELAQLFDRGGPDLCASCMVGTSGYLEECRIAGAAAANPSIKAGAKKMMSMIYIAKRDGSSAAGTPIGIPVHFGKLLDPPAGGYGSNPASGFRP